MTSVCVSYLFRQIMSLSNSLMYEGRLECGSERTAAALLTLPFLLSVQSELSSYSEAHPQHALSWIQPTLLPSNPVCFLDCSMVSTVKRTLQTFYNLKCVEVVNIK